MQTVDFSKYEKRKHITECRFGLKRPTVLPLPKGEGLGEGKRRIHLLDFGIWNFSGCWMLELGAFTRWLSKRAKSGLSGF